MKSKKNKYLSLLAAVLVLITLMSGCMVPGNRAGSSPDEFKDRVIKNFRIKPRVINSVYWEDFPNTIIFLGTERPRQYLYRYWLDEGKSEKLLPDYVAYTSAINPDRTEIAFYGFTPGGGGKFIHIYNLEDNTVRTLEGIEGVPEAWSPDNKYLAIAGGCDDNEREKACSSVYNFEETKVEKVKIENELDEWLDTSWSQDGEKIAFILGVPSNYGDYGLRVYDWQDFQPLINVKPIPQGARLRYPKWVRGGEWIVYIQNGPGINEASIRFVHAHDPNCRVDPRLDTNEIYEYDVLEKDGNMYFVFLTADNDLYTLDFAKAISPMKIDELLVCH